MARSSTPSDLPFSSSGADDATDDAGADEGGRLGRAASELVRRLIDLGIDGAGPLPAAAAAAASARRRHPDTDRAVHSVAASATRSAAVAGFVTGLGGFITLPVALPANLLGFYVIATRTVAATAALRGYDLEAPAVRTAVLLAVAGDDAGSVLTRFGLGGPGGLVSRLARRQLSGPGLAVLNRAIGFQLLSRIGRNSLVARLGRGVPFAGGLLGGGVDAWALRRIARSARDAFPEVTPGTAAASALGTPRSVITDGESAGESA